MPGRSGPLQAALPGARATSLIDGEYEMDITRRARQETDEKNCMPRRERLAV
jgi:hypothetical protein